ncbi:ABC transporter permease subunit [Paenibacillus sp. LMG 31458]|uniref:ABC transporter permease subunit n=1 Tax=Paenibacillus phytorum TaxID=2654977 RepID=A0ABX1XPA6_9BACL|nr:sugar ABC transporter permease [Paenibacillus phytorum]NOU70372.1 ABC transporter permease subunit [Paenibacillus phytorum]
MVQSKAQRMKFLAFCLLPTFVMFAIFSLFPLFSGMYYSFFKWSGSGGNKTFVGLKNYIRLFNDPVIPQTIYHDYFLVFFKVLLIMLIATFFAVVLTQFRIKEAAFYRVIFFFPNIMSVVVVGILWMFIYNPNMGIVNSGLRQLGLESMAKPWLGDMTWALPSLVLPAVWAGIGLFMLMIMGGISNIPTSIYEAADVDGATRWEQFWKITVPLIWAQLKSSIIYIVITTLNGSFVIVQIMTEGGPSNSTHVMGSYLYQQAFVNYNFGYAAAIGVMILVFSLITVLLLQLLLKREKIQY